MGGGGEGEGGFFTKGYFFRTMCYCFPCCFQEIKISVGGQGSKVE